MTLSPMIWGKGRSFPCLTAPGSPAWAGAAEGARGIHGGEEESAQGVGFSEFLISSIGAQGRLQGFSAGSLERPRDHSQAAGLLCAHSYVHSSAIFLLP